MTEQRYHVIGLICVRCAAAVEREVRRLTGVEAVAVDIVAGTVTVTGGAVDENRVAAAIEDAGYEVAAVR
ncbi:heavy-metal-associated domain-containing protein [Streptomyces fructofermentans]|uniref:HMA domain-containing protein n=1 Tax=Streptomyces fructofermentans TaxID=152141 RepID=A0A918KB97_9ACTN|nr:heavy-metal-associated domain-containing protein [Streptomyces fructofermentans]GGX57353.1 hypothetical protein GCM10010515_26170 [Streptomyces fructofermentans]